MSYTGTGLAVRSPSAPMRRSAPPRAPGLGGFFDDQLPNFFKKAVRYQGAYLVSPFLDQPTAKKMFGLSKGESKVFQITANVQRAVALAAVGAGLYGWGSSAAASKAAASAATSKAFPLTTSGFSFTTQAAPTFAATASSAAPLAAAAPAAAAPAAAASSGGLLGLIKAGGGSIGKLVLGGAVLGKVLGQGGQVIRESAQVFSEGYRETSGQNLPVNDILNLARQAAAEVRNRIAPAPSGGGSYAPEAPAVVEAGVNWPVVLGAGALALGVLKLAKDSRGRR